MKIFKTLLITSVVCLGTSCLKQTESITPVASVRTLAELQRESMMNAALRAAGNNELSTSTKANVEESAEPGIFYLNMKYNIEDLDVFETTHIPNSFEQIGNSFLKSLAAIFIKLSGERTVKIGTVEVPIPDINLDFDVVRSIKIKKIYLQYNKNLDDSTGNIADFSFINSFDVASLKGVKIFSYQKANNKCLQKCLDFTIVNQNILDMIKNVQSIKVNPTLTISSLPKITALKLDGQIELQIGLKLPF